MDAPVVLAHVGPVHEAAFVVVPLVLLGVILYVGRRRDMNDDVGRGGPGSDRDDTPTT